MRRYDVAPTPDNYALWYEYHGGNNTGLNTTMSVIISNDGGFNATTMYELHAAFISSPKEAALVCELQIALRDASTDALTGAANRKAFDTTIRKLAGDAMNSGDGLALLMVDADRFKRVNDTWGHQVGDEILRHIAAALKESVRGGDVVALYGGEEFAVILPRTDADSAVSVAENIRRTLLRQPLYLNVAPPLDAITVSIGVSCYEPGDPLTEWIGRADSALYQAKEAGRNCVQCA